MQAAPSAEVARRRKVIAVFALPLLFGAVQIGIRLSQRTTSTARKCVVFVPGINGQPGFEANLACTPLTFDTTTSAASWRWPLVVGLSAVAIIGLAVAWVMVPRVTRSAVAPDHADGSVVPLVGRARGRRTKYRLAKGSRWMGIPFAVAGLGGGGALLLLPTGAPAAICWMFIGFGAVMAVMSNVGSIIASDNGLSLRLMFHRKRWTWEQIWKIGATDTQVGVAQVRRRMLVVHLNNGRRFANELLTSSAWGTHHSRVDRLVASLELHRRGCVGRIGE